ncbi:MAG: LLM class flavin-dependent oxidoreductase [Gammaproteobacteria bacterium]
MRFSTMIWPFSGTTLAPVVELAKFADEHGYESVYVGDSQMLWNDAWVALGLCAAATRRVRLGPGVTNTVTRHPAVTANVIMTINMVSQGRAVLGVGAGDSAVRTAGLSPARLADIRAATIYMRTLLNGDAAAPYVPGALRRENTWGMVDQVRLEGAKEWGRVPFELACMGPKAVELAGELYDGIIVDGHMGGNAEGARATVEAARRGALRAGRDPSQLRFIAAIDGAVEDTRGAALDQVRATAARNIARKPYLPDCLGVVHAETVRAVSEAYRFDQHLDLTARHRNLIPDEVAMQCCIAGTPDDCIAKARELKHAGITDIAVFVTSQDFTASQRKLERFAREVMPFV